MNKFSKLILTCGLLFFLLSGYAQKAIVQTDSLVTILQSRQYKIPKGIFRTRKIDNKQES